MSTNDLVARYRDVMERSRAVRLEAKKIRQESEHLRLSCEALRAAAAASGQHTAAVVQQAVSTYHRGVQLKNQCNDDLSNARTLFDAQRELEKDIRRAEIDRAVNRIIDVFAGRGAFAFRWDAHPEMPILAAPRPVRRDVTRVQ